MEIKVNSSKSERTVTVNAPECITVETLQEMVDLLDEELVLNKVKAQLKLDFRAHIRTKLDSMDDGEPRYTDDEIATADYADWRPEGRTRKSSSDKALEMLGKLSADELAVVLAQHGIEVQ